VLAVDDVNRWPCTDDDEPAARDEVVVRPEAGGTSGSTGGPVDPRDTRIVFLGDSYVTGLGDGTCLGWVGRLCAAAQSRGYRLACYNLGILRSSTVDLLVRLDHEVRPRLPAGIDGRLVIAPGISDLIEHVPLAQTESTVRTLAERARARHPVLAVGPPPGTWPERNRRIRALAQLYEQAFAAAGIAYLDVFDRLMASDAWMRAARRYDGFHPTGEGYADLAALVAVWDQWRGWFPNVAPEDITV
jgi:acyl-CoA thioesterase I